MRKSGLKQGQAGPSGGLIQWTYLNKRFGSEQGLERDVMLALKKEQLRKKTWDMRKPRGCCLGKGLGSQITRHFCALWQYPEVQPPSQNLPCCCKSDCFPVKKQTNKQKKQPSVPNSMCFTIHSACYAMKSCCLCTARSGPIYILIHMASPNFQNYSRWCSTRLTVCTWETVGLTRHPNCGFQGQLYFLFHCITVLSRVI